MDWWRYNKLNLLLSFLIVVMLGCNSKVTKRYEIEGLTIGLNHYEVFKLDKKDSLEFLPPPPPPFEGNMSNVNVFEAKNGFVYFYVFKTKESVCGYASENEKYKFEVYNPELKASCPANVSRRGRLQEGCNK